MPARSPTLPERFIISFHSRPSNRAAFFVLVGLGRKSWPGGLVGRQLGAGPAGLFRSSLGPCTLNFGGPRRGPPAIYDVMKPALRSSCAAFTLVEIMIVVVIIGLLVTMAMPAFQKIRSASQDKAVLNNARQLSA